MAWGKIRTNTTGKVDELSLRITRKSFFGSIFVGALVGGLLYWIDNQLSTRVGQVEIGIAFSPNEVGSGSNGATATTIFVLDSTTSTVPGEITLTSSTTTSSTTTTTTTIVLPANVDATWREILVSLTNAERAEQGLGPLKSCGTLHVAAQRHAQDMHDQNFFEHTNPFTGENPSDRAAQAGYGAGAGENIAMGYPSPKSVTQGWMNSPGHRENILGDYTHIGIGIVYGGSGDYGDGEWFYWVQNFGISGDCG